MAIRRSLSSRGVHWKLWLEKKWMHSSAVRQITCRDAVTQQIKAAGPVTVAEYMRHCLLHPVYGYYMQGDVFGKKGDFTTAPEVSQVFGELLAVWILSDWKARGEQLPVQLVELGPGRGTLLSDILRVFQNKKLCSILEGLSIHLVEASPAMAELQASTIQASQFTAPSSSSSPGSLKGVELGEQELGQGEKVMGSGCYQSGRMAGDVAVAWYKQLKDVPQGHSYFIAQEFFDALPIHQFQMTSSGWREVLVDLDPSSSDGMPLRFVLSRADTAASVTYSALLDSSGEEAQEGEWLEVSPQGLLCVEEMAERVVTCGGAALIADYGGVGRNENSLRSFKDHQLHDVLESPGIADITANVDFKALAKIAASKGAGCCGPITQNEFLHKMGIRQRIEILMNSVSPAEARSLVSGYEMLTSPEKMGEKFKLFSVTSSPVHVPVPFFENEKLFK